MYSQLVTSILNEPEFSESSELSFEEIQSADEYLSDEEEYVYHYHQNENTYSFNKDSKIANFESYDLITENYKTRNESNLVSDYLLTESPF